MKIKVKVNDQFFDVEIGDLRTRPILATIDGEDFEVWPETKTAYTANTTDRLISLKEHSKSIATKPEQHVRPTEAGAPESPRGADQLIVRAPIPGVITAILVQPGSEVEIGQELCKLEAMKMNNSIRSSRNGRIASIHISVGQQVKHHDPLIEYAEN